MHYFIDGYNLLFRLLGDGDLLRDQRDWIIWDLSEKLQFLDLDITIVFDATYCHGNSNRSHYKNLEIIYTSSDETADEYIITELSNIENPRQETVVTSDKKLAWLARRLNAKTESIEQFNRWLNQRYKNKRKGVKKEKPTKETKLQEDMLPILEGSQDKNVNLYLKAFEKRYGELEKETTSQKKNEPSESEVERWLRIFEERLNLDSDH